MDSSSSKPSKHKSHSNKSRKRKLETADLSMEENNVGSDNTSLLENDTNSAVLQNDIEAYFRRKHHKIHLRPSSEHLRKHQTKEIDCGGLEDREIQTEIRKKKLTEIMQIPIDIDWAIPVSHIRLNMLLKNELIELAKEAGLKLRFGRFTPDEDEVMIRNWEKFQEMSGIDDVETMKAFHGKKTFNMSTRHKKLQFYQFIGRGLNNRILPTIRERFWVLMSSVKTGRFSEEESAFIVNFVQEYGRDLTLLAKIMKRSYGSVSYHYSTLTQTIDPATQHFTGEEDEKLVLSVLKRGRYKTTAEVVEKNVNWEKVGRDMGRTVQSVKWRWKYQVKLKMGLKTSYDLFELRCKLIYRLLELNVKFPQDVDWPSLSQEILGINSWYLPVQLCTVIKLAKIVDPKKKTLRECLEILRDNWIPSRRRKPPRSKIIPLILNKDGKLVPKEDSDNEEQAN